MVQGTLPRGFKRPVCSWRAHHCTHLRGAAGGPFTGYAQSARAVTASCNRPVAVSGRKREACGLPSLYTRWGGDRDLAPGEDDHGEQDHGVRGHLGRRAARAARRPGPRRRAAPAGAGRPGPARPRGPQPARPALRTPGPRRGHRPARQRQVHPDEAGGARHPRRLPGHPRPLGRPRAALPAVRRLPPAGPPRALRRAAQGPARGRGSRRARLRHAGVGARLAGPRGPAPRRQPALAAPRRHGATGAGRPARARPGRLAVRVPAAPRGAPG
ncbi:hypothetical protein SGRIM128S_07180 [Streptomyces griseomycini]